MKRVKSNHVVIIERNDPPELAASIKQVLTDFYNNLSPKHGFEIWDLLNRELILFVDNHQYVIPFPPELSCNVLL